VWYARDGPYPIPPAPRLRSRGAHTSAHQGYAPPRPLCRVWHGGHGSGVPAAVPGAPHAETPPVVRMPPRACAPEERAQARTRDTLHRARAPVGRAPAFAMPARTPVGRTTAPRASQLTVCNISVGDEIAELRSSGSMILSDKVRNDNAEGRFEQRGALSCGPRSCLTTTADNYRIFAFARRE